jgi:7-cyano-7-deazaguanine reductase
MTASQHDSMTAGITALGRRVGETFETFPVPDTVERVTLINEDFTAICPVTDQRDFYQVIASYMPDQVCLESKTWRLYLAGFANDGAFCESLASRICTDLWDALEPMDIRVSLTQRMHGGTIIKAHAHRSRLPQPAAGKGGTHHGRYRT